MRWKEQHCAVDRALAVAPMRARLRTCPRCRRIEQADLRGLQEILTVLTPDAYLPIVPASQDRRTGAVCGVVAWRGPEARGGALMPATAN